MEYPQLYKVLVKFIDCLCLLLPILILVSLFIDTITQSLIKTYIEGALLVIVWVSYRLWWHKYIRPF